MFDGESLVGHFCGQYSLKTFTSMSDELFIRFSINYPEEKEYSHYDTFSGGFLARYKQVERKYYRYFRPQIYTLIECSNHLKIRLAVAEQYVLYYDLEHLF